MSKPNSLNFLSTVRFSSSDSPALSIAAAREVTLLYCFPFQVKMPSSWSQSRLVFPPLPLPLPPWFFIQSA